MADAELERAQRVIVVGSSDLQTRHLCDSLARETGVGCGIKDSFSDAVQNALLAQTTTLLLTDCSRLSEAHFASVLGQHGRSLPEHVIVAFFNVKAGSACETDAVPLGVHGLIYWDAGFELLVRAVKALLSGDVWIPRRILMDAAVQSHSSPQLSTTENGAGVLTRRETEILALICVGKSNDEIGEQLFISTNTVKTHIYNIYRKIGVPNRMQAVLWGAKHL